MNSARIGIVAALALAMACAPSAGWAGGDADEHDHEQDPNAGPSYHGFVKDHRGVLVAEAKVTAEIKNRGTLVTHTNILGAYRLNNFGKEINPDEVTITCSKQGYRQLRVVRRHETNEDRNAIEIECTMQRL